jgi:ATPase subunit of ABC transporter with duplicated ATPase domains
VEAASIEQVLEEQLDFAQSPLEVCGTSTTARTLLGCLKVPLECLNRPLASLSGGERTKVAMAKILNAKANLLLLDEPTNHLEVEAQEALEAALAIYPGAVIAVSHDRAFLESLGADAKRIELPLTQERDEIDDAEPDHHARRDPQEHCARRRRLDAGGQVAVAEVDGPDGNYGQ